MVGSLIRCSFLEMPNALLPVTNCITLHTVRKIEISLYYFRKCAIGNWLNSVGELKK